MESKPMRILYWDIETSLMPVAIFQLAHNDWIQPDAIIEERYIICASWMWEGESKVHSVSVLDDPKRYEKDPHDDRHVVETLHKVLSTADLSVTHNGESFDKRYLDTRALVHGLPALPPIPFVDTYKVAKQKLLFNSNKLTYIGKLLGVGEKIQTTPGLWMKILQGQKSAIKEMIRYNQGDVTLLRNVYLKLRPFTQNHLSHHLFGKTGCPRCGSQKIQSRGVHRAINRVYQRLQCQACGGWFKHLKAETEPAATTRLL